MSNSLQPYGALQVSCPWDSPGKNTEVGCHTLPPEDLPDSGIELINASPATPALKVDSLSLSHRGSPPTHIETCIYIYTHTQTHAHI